ncbi:MAG: sugar kinase [Cytophagales bacterium]|nr:MAG: sugar kinase [Cytophagales bacterium]
MVYYPPIISNRIKMISTTAIFDIGKTNKKILLFNDALELVHEVQQNFNEIEDEDGSPCENLKELTNWMLNAWKNIEQDTRFHVKALNFTTYGASFVHLDAHDIPVTPLYNYLKPFPEHLSKQFYKKYGNPIDIATTTASPVLGMLNSGLQIYWLKYEHPLLFNKIAHSLHFPQYCSWLFTKEFASEFTSIGCHTMIWNHEKNNYHDWVIEEGIDKLFPKISRSPELGTTLFRGIKIPVGTGLHDSSSALIPYLKKSKEPFLLLSTGTWCITLNPFAKNNITQEELSKDCLNFLTFEGKQVKASRLFIGNDHEILTKRFAAHFFREKDFYKQIKLDKIILEKAKSKTSLIKDYYQTEEFKIPDLDVFETYEEAYHKLIWDMVQLQKKSILIASENDYKGKSLFIDGGFSRNPIFITLLREAIPELKIESYEINQGTALGACMMMN